MMLKNIVLVGLGGAIGSVLRYVSSIFVDRYFSSVFPWATFAVNIVGCLLVGLLLGIFERQQLATAEIRLLFVTGFCGGYTTFSTFAAENLTLIQYEQFGLAVLYTVLSVLIGIAAVWLGISLAR
jgi:CrcB protein